MTKPKLNKLDLEAGEVIEVKEKKAPYTHPDYFWSFSSITSYLTCPYQFKLRYIDRVEDMGNAFSDYGNFVHEILEKWAIGELMDFELSDYYDENYADAIRHDFPPFPKTMAANSYNLGKSYFDDFAGFGDEYEIVSAEERFEIKMGKYNFRGISDLILRNKNTGKYMVVDHKTKSPTSMAKERELYTKQLYVYAKHVFTKYGEWPDVMAFNMTKGNNMLYEKFDIEKMKQVEQWVVESIEKILQETEWPIGGDSYFCQNICSYRHMCDFSNRFKADWARKKEKEEGGSKDV